MQNAIYIEKLFKIFVKSHKMLSTDSSQDFLLYIGTSIHKRVRLLKFEDNCKIDKSNDFDYFFVLITIVSTILMNLSILTYPRL